jgi:NTP pyrophosphatase (non-canonical NTP hydrolase)
MRVLLEEELRDDNLIPLGFRCFSLRAANITRAREWGQGSNGDVQLSLSFRGNELAGETGEACNIIKKIERERLGLRGSRATPDQLKDELADVAMEFGFDMEEAVADKFNATSRERGLKTRLVW